KDTEDPSWSTSFKNRRAQKTSSALEAPWKTLFVLYLYLIGTLNDQSHVDESNYNLRSSDVYASSSLRGRGRGGSSSRYNLVDEDSDIEEEDVEEDESGHNKKRCTFEDDDDDGECDDLD
ncbi:hypothetical protein Tco_1051806, partial [Tanacetum coccineum]